MTVRRTRAKKQKTRKVEARKAPLKRTKRTRTVAEAHGLAHRDALIASKPSVPNARESSAVTNIINQQFGLWSAMLRMSPVPVVLRQQAAVAKLFMAFVLPPDAGKEK
jgi:hypothetical protein